MKSLTNYIDILERKIEFERSRISSYGEHGLWRMAADHQEYVAGMVAALYIAKEVHALADIENSMKAKV